MPRAYTFRRRVQFAETDAAGIVHFATYFRYMEEAEHAMWRDAGLTIYRHGADIGWPRVAAAFDYHGPLRFEEEFEVAIAVLAVKSRTIEYACSIIRRGEKIATGRMTIACVRKLPGGSMAATDVPEEIAGRLA